MDLPDWFRWVFNGVTIVTYIALIALVVEALRKRTPRYSVRTLFIITTVVSVAMGAAVYVLRK